MAVGLAIDTGNVTASIAGLGTLHSRRLTGLAGEKQADHALMDGVTTIIEGKVPTVRRLRNIILRLAVLAIIVMAIAVALGKN